MRDAFGGAFFIKFMLIFLAIYIAFIAIALNYAKAFRIKNTIINIIEENEGYGIKVQELVDNYVSSMGYYVYSVGPDPVNSGKDTSSTSFYDASIYGNGCTSRGYCVKKVFVDCEDIYSYNSNCSELRGSYYKVTTYLEVRFPFFGINFAVPISGETRLVTDGS